MDVKKIALLAGALVIAVTMAFLARSMMSGSPAPQAAASAMPVDATTPRVLVAVKPLPVGTILEAESLRFQPWPKELIDQAYYLESQTNLQKLVGSVVRTAISAGQPVSQSGIVRPGERGFLAAALAPGMRAVTVPVSVSTSVAGFIFPGDRVDLLLTQSVAGGGSGEPLKVTETVLRNLRVLATDQRTNPVGEDGKPLVQTFSNVTIEVTPRIAEKIAVAQTVGTLSLSLRAMSDSASSLDAAIASGGDLPKNASPAAEKAALASLSARPIDKGETFVTGADVSRYQRATVPPKAPVATTDASGAPAAAPVTGPVVRIARGTNVTAVPVGGK